MVNKKAVKELKDGLAKFKEDALSKGWEEDEVDEKVTEVFENFAWYKFNPPKKSLKSKLWKLLLFLLIVYLAYSAVAKRNRRIRKAVDDFFFDNQYQYHTQRVFRILTIPFFRLYDFSVIHDDECLIKNPFIPKPEVVCDFCEGLDNLYTLKEDHAEIPEMLKDGSPFIISNVPGYHNISTGVNDFKSIFAQNHEAIDEAICIIKLTKEFTKVSDYFKLTEEEIMKKNISIGWRNCGTYGTRFYRKLFPRPSFIPKESEVYLEKEIYITQKGQNVSMDASRLLDGETMYVAQIQGESEISLAVPNDCFYNCTTEPLTKTLKQGHMLVYANSGWEFTFRSISDGLSIVYLSTFT